MTTRVRPLAALLALLALLVSVTGEVWAYGCAMPAEADASASHAQHGGGDGHDGHAAHAPASDAGHGGHGGHGSHAPAPEHDRVPEPHPCPSPAAMAAGCALPAAVPAAADRIDFGEASEPALTPAPAPVHGRLAALSLFRPPQR